MEEVSVEIVSPADVTDVEEEEEEDDDDRTDYKSDPSERKYGPADLMKNSSPPVVVVEMTTPKIVVAAAANVQPVTRNKSLTTIVPSTRTSIRPPIITPLATTTVQLPLADYDEWLTEDSTRRDTACNKWSKHFLQWYLFAWFLTLLIGGAIFGSRQLRFSQVLCTGWASREQCIKAGYGYVCVAWTTASSASGATGEVGVSLMDDDSWTGHNFPDTCWKDDNTVSAATFNNPSTQLRTFWIVLFSFLGFWFLLVYGYFYALRRSDFRANKLRIQREWHASVRAQRRARVVEAISRKTKTKKFASKFAGKHSDENKSTGTNTPKKHRPRPPSSSCSIDEATLPSLMIEVASPPVFISSQ